MPWHPWHPQEWHPSVKYAIVKLICSIAMRCKNMEESKMITPFPVKFWTVKVLLIPCDYPAQVLAQPRDFLTGGRLLNVTYYCWSKFQNRIFHRSFIRVRLSKLTQPTRHPWVDPMGDGTNLNVRIQQIWSLLSTKKYDNHGKISFNYDMTQKSWRSPLQSILLT